MSPHGMGEATWVGPYQVRFLLEHCLDDAQPWPPEDTGIYVVSELAWQVCPSQQARVLYVGGNPNNPVELRNLIGLLLKDMFGFWGDVTGSHSGGQTLWCYCHENTISPLNLYLGWAVGISCSRCAENTFYDLLQPSLNKKRPARCSERVEVEG
ncbi:MAG TPA: hypothetical protein VG013_29085 [Gemmataceae bacterium]|nr:hypothetical protein [Gemmataceae bacterium]